MLNFLKLIALVIAVVGFGGNAQAQFKQPNELSLVRSVWVEINDDDAKDGCLPNPNVLKVEAELTLRRAGIGVVSDQMVSGFSLEVYIVGFEVKRENNIGTGTCAVFIDVQLYRIARVSEGHFATVDAYTNGTLLILHKNNLQEELRKLVSGFTSDLANEILKAKGK